MERYRNLSALPPKPQSKITWLISRVTGPLDTVQGLFIPFFFLAVTFGTFLAVVVSAAYGPWAFLLLMGSIIGGLGLYGEKKLGESAQFGEYHVLKNALGTALGFLVFLGILALLLFLAHVPPF
ncbi:MAG TPA: hypothetical protein VGS11_06660 [Candidatus Bathyarchaeia archaeon]|nr:hypothetical protein [Candidatus Bathyarchaeia archaeon]